MDDHGAVHRLARRAIVATNRCECFFARSRAKPHASSSRAGPRNHRYLWGDDPRDRDDNSRDLSRGSRGGQTRATGSALNPRDVFMEHVSLPRGLEREHVHHHGHDYTLRGSESAR